MKMNYSPSGVTLAGMTLAAMLTASLSTAAFAGRGDDMGFKDGPMHGLIFETLDADKDGKVTKAEMDAAAAARTKAADTNADGKLSVEELAAMQIRAMTERANVRATKMIAKLDTDGDKLLSEVEMLAAKGHGDVFEKMDTDGDGAITKAEADDARARMKERGRGGKHGRGDKDGSNN